MKLVTQLIGLALVCLFLFSQNNVAFALDPAKEEKAKLITTTLDAVATEPESTKADSTKLAQAFLQTLPQEQRALVLYDMKPDALAKWSNVPATYENRNGIALGDLSPDSLKAALKLIRSSLSKEGFQTASEVIKADAFLSKIENPRFVWGADLYFLSIHGKPSETDPWLMQFTGHHLAENIAFHTEKPGVTPQFIGIEPRGFEWDGQYYAPYESRLTALNTLFLSLDDQQQKSAQLNQLFEDIVVGPGKDGQFPKQEGLSYTQLTKQQQAHLKAIITKWLSGISKEDQQQLATAYMTDQALTGTTISWSNSPDLTKQGAYVRIDGPRLWLEASSRVGAAKADDLHIHSIWRDKQADYGRLQLNEL